MKKRGLSPVIATVLLIALVLVLAAIIFMWARGFISEQIEKFGTPIEDLCGNVDFDIEVIKEVGEIGYEFDIANRGNVPIFKFDIKEIKGGESSIQQFPISLDEGDSKSEHVSLKSDTEKIIVYPVLIGNIRGKSINKVFTCSEHGKSMVL
tara:strand:+ start:1576 stop:2028 length:453 start_codon:yes stop_codon:yes gene_type:complete